MTRNTSVTQHTIATSTSPNDPMASSHLRIDADLLIPGRGDPIKTATLICGTEKADSSDEKSADNRQNFEKQVPPMSPIGQNMEVPTEADPSERADWVPPQVKMLHHASCQLQA